jgi:hypothetical protein
MGVDPYKWFCTISAAVSTKQDGKFLTKDGSHETSLLGESRQNTRSVRLRCRTGEWAYTRLLADRVDNVLHARHPVSSGDPLGRNRFYGWTWLLQVTTQTGASTASVEFESEIGMSHTGQTNYVSGIYRSVGCHSVERAIPYGHTFPPCPHCHHSVAWVLVRRTQTT